jgi:aspartyl-tRNA(Asn)/glutamyl-tRNA(Gln) amidotransferase subunit A
MTRDLALASAAELVRLYRRRKASPVETAKACLARIARLNPALNAFVLVDEAAALKGARASERRWSKGAPLGAIDGVPATIKDIVLTKGWPTLRGSQTVDPHQPWNDDAPATARLREAGAVLLGKTTTPEFGWKGVTDSPLTGITRNPWNRDRTPGGSSGGAAVAAACGMGALHIGTDGGGSIRIPAAFTGIFGIKQTFGRVPAWPISPFGTLANIGPMTRTVEDAALMLSVISCPDWRDWYASARPGEDFTRGLKAGIKGLRVAWSPTLGGQRVLPAVAERTAEAAKAFRALGARVEEAEPEIGAAGEIFRAHWFVTAHVIVEAIAPEKRHMIEPGLLETARMGGEYSGAALIREEIARRELGFRVNKFFRDYDLLLTPTMPIPAFDVGKLAPQLPGENAWVDWTPFTYPFNLSRNPAATVPCGFVDGLPVGLQIVGRHDEDALVLRAAYAFEQAHPWPMPSLDTSALLSG